MDMGRGERSAAGVNGRQRMNSGPKSRVALACWAAMTAAAWGADVRAAVAAGEARDGKVALTVFASSADVAAFPVEIGLPLPAGALKDAAAIRLLDATGKEVPLQVEPLSRYADGSLRAALLIFLSPILKDKSVEYTIEFGPGVRPKAPTTPITVTEKDGLATLDTGLVRLEVGKDGPMVSAVQANGKALLPNGIGSFIQEAGQKELLFSKNAEVRVEEAGPIRGAVLVKGRFGEAADAHGYEARIHAYAGTGLVRVQYTVVGLDGKKPFELAGWGLGLNAGARRASCGLDGAARDIDLARGEGLFQDAVFEYAWGSLTVEERQARLKKLLPLKPGEQPGWRYKMLCTVGKNGPAEAKADGWLWAQLAGGAVAICVRDFWQEFAKEWAGGKDETAVWLHSPRGKPFIANAGTAKTGEILFDFSPDGRGAGTAAALNAAFQDWPVARVWPEWVCATGLFGELLPRSDPFGEHYNAIADVCLAFIKQSSEIITQGITWYLYGDADFGDLTKYLFNYNVPRGQNWAYTVEFLRGGDREWARLGARATRHYGDIDVCHVKTDKSDVGCSWIPDRPDAAFRQNITWRTPSQPVAGKDESLEAKIKNFAEKFAAVTLPRDVHQGRPGAGGEGHTAGALPYYFLSGDRRALAVLREQGEWLVSQMGKKGQVLSDYDSYWLPGLLDAYEATGEAKFLQGAARVVQSLIDLWQMPLDKRREIGPLTEQLAAGRGGKGRRLPAHGYWPPLSFGGGRPMEPYVRRPRSVFRFLALNVPEASTGLDNDLIRRMLAECMETSMQWFDGGCTPAYIHPWTAAANLGLWPEQTRLEFEEKVLLMVAMARRTDPYMYGTSYWDVKGGAKQPPVAAFKYKLPFLQYRLRRGGEGAFAPLDVQAIRQNVIGASAAAAFTCHLHELGIEQAMMSYPHFLAAWKTYHEKYLKPRMSADGVLEFAIAREAPATRPAD